MQAIVWVREETFMAESETADLWQPKWNENQIVLAAAIHNPDRDAGPLESFGTGSWSLGIVEQSQGKGCCWLQTDQRDVREEIVMGNACGGKLDSHGSMVICWVMHGHGTITITSISPHTSFSSWKIERLVHQMPNALNYRVGHHSGCPFKCLMCRSTE